jgi:hypothetical protein
MAMAKVGYVVLLSMLAATPAVASNNDCPVMLVRGTADADTISVVFRNNTKLPIRRMEFNCRLSDARLAKASPTRCYEPNASFLPKVEYTLQYAYPSGKRGPILVSLKSIQFSDGHIWTPSKKEGCRLLTFALPHVTQKAGKVGPH